MHFPKLGHMHNSLRICDSGLAVSVSAVLEPFKPQVQRFRKSAFLSVNCDDYDIKLFLK